MAVRTLIASIGIAVGAATAPITPGHAAATDGPLKAAMVLNIVRFVDFGDAIEGEPLHVCVDGAASAAPAMVALHGERIGPRTIALHAVDLNRPGHCHVFYLEAQGLTSVSRLRRPGVLLIGEGPAFLDAGGTIALVRPDPGKPLRFEANVGAARAARIVLSSKLLRLAARVR